MLLPASIAELDFVELQPISVVNSAVVNLLTADDDITLEYDDRVKLTFTPSSADLLSDVDSLGEYIRDTATVNIVDYDSKHFYHYFYHFLLEVLILSLPFQS